MHPYCTQWGTIRPISIQGWGGGRWGDIMFADFLEKYYINGGSGQYKADHSDVTEY